ncbi:hypothetical protein CHCC20369_1030 [Bacillus licheniformis]|nr:hypothetical protein CHCC20369_1030 [Bacillus licheniformis]TWK34282.1 hypothetical protein CHCC20368_0764 [Bacillus licheniformis]
MTFSLHHYRQAKKCLDSSESADMKLKKLKYNFKLSEVYYQF